MDKQAACEWIDETEKWLDDIKSRPGGVPDEETERFILECKNTVTTLVGTDSEYYRTIASIEERHRLSLNVAHPLFFAVLNGLRRDIKSGRVAVRPDNTDLAASEGTITIFLSHSNKDVEIARALIDLLRATLNLPSSAIRCTSVPGYKLPVGADTDDALRKEIHESRAFIGLITDVSFESAYVLFELGARWGANKQMAPLLAAGTKASVLKGPIGGNNALSCDVRGDLHQLVNDLAQVMKRSVEPAASYEEKLDALLEASKRVMEQRLQTAATSAGSDQVHSPQKGSPGTRIELSNAEARYLMSLSRPRNQQGIPIGFFDSFARRETEQYQAMLDRFIELGLLRLGSATYLLTQAGYASADELWRIFVLKAVKSHQSGQWEYVDTETIATASTLTDGEDEARELNRHLQRLSDEGLLEIVPCDGGIAKTRMTADGHAKLRAYAQLDFDTVD